MPHAGYGDEDDSYSSYYYNPSTNYKPYVDGTYGRAPKPYYPAKAAAKTAGGDSYDGSYDGGYYGEENKYLPGTSLIAYLTHSPSSYGGRYDGEYDEEKLGKLLLKYVINWYNDEVVVPDATGNTDSITPRTPVEWGEHPKLPMVEPGTYGLFIKHGYYPRNSYGGSYGEYPGGGGCLGVRAAGFFIGLPAWVGKPHPPLVTHTRRHQHGRGQLCIAPHTLSLTHTHSFTLSHSHSLIPQVTTTSLTTSLATSTAQGRTRTDQVKHRPTHARVAPKCVAGSQGRQHSHHSSSHSLPALPASASCIQTCVKFARHVVAAAAYGRRRIRPAL